MAKWLVIEDYSSAAMGRVEAGTVLDDAQVTVPAGVAVVPYSTAYDGAIHAFRGARRVFGERSMGGFALALADLLALPTIHFNVGIGTPALGTPGTLTPAAAAFFGQLHMHARARISVLHLHVVEDGASGTATVEVYRRRGGVATLLGAITQASGVGDFSTVPVVPATEALQTVEPGDYLFCQATAATLFTAGGANGITVDVHFAPAPLLGI